MLIGTTSRFISGRNVIRTVYWRTAANSDRLIKTNKTIHHSGKTKYSMDMDQTLHQKDSVWIPKQI